MGKKVTYARKRFESGKPGQTGHDSFSAIYDTMMMSEAWQALSFRQRYLYWCCKHEYRRARKSKRDDLRPFKEFFENERISEERKDEFFTMNWAKVKKGGLYNMYSKQSDFITDINALINHGFIDCVFPGAESRRKNLYRYSDRWWNYGTDEFNVPYNVMTLSCKREYERPFTDT